MAVGLVESTVGTNDVPESVLALGSLPEVDYADLFTLTTGTEATPERWARAMFGNVPSLTELLIWRGLLGLRLSRGRSPATVAGWQIGERGADWIRLEAASAFLSCNLVVQTAEGRVSLGTFLHYDRRLGRSLWLPLSAVHRRVVPGLLRDAAARAATDSPGADRAGSGRAPTSLARKRSRGASGSFSFLTRSALSVGRSPMRGWKQWIAR